MSNSVPATSRQKQEQKEKMEEKPCNICGAVGWRELMSTCSKCGEACEHVYCMRLHDGEVPEVWICEDCIPDEGGCDGKENFQITSNLPHHDVAMQGSFTKVDDDSGQHGHSRRLKPAETGKVKFLSTEEVIRLSSGAVKMGSPSNSNLGYRLGSSSVASKLSPLRVKKNPKIISPGIRKPPVHGGSQFSSLTSQQEPRTSKGPEQKADINPAKECNYKVTVSPVKERGCKAQKITYIKPPKGVGICNANVLAKEMKIFNANMIAKEVKAWNMEAEEDVNKSPNISDISVQHSPIVGRSSCLVAESKKSDVELKHPTSTLPKLCLFRPYFPSRHPTWRGGFKFFDTATAGKFYGGFQAQPPCIVSRKAYEFSQTMPVVLQVKLLPQHHVFADLFQNDHPDLYDIALYFLPSANIDRSKTYSSLFHLLEMQNSVMRSYINDVELLIFTSKHLRGDVQDVSERLSTKQFLWGVFHQEKRVKIPLEQDSASVECIETVDMEIDMVGGQAMGRVDTIGTKESSQTIYREFNKKTVNENTLEMPNYKILSAFEDTDSIQQLRSESKQAQCNLISLFSEAAWKINSKLASVDPLQNSVEKLLLVTDGADVPPGFEDLSRKKFKNTSYKASFTEESHLNDGKDVSPVKKGNVDLQEVIGNGYPQSCPIKVKTEAQKVKSDEQSLNHKSSGCSPSETGRPTSWNPPPTDWVKLNVVGRSKENPVTAGASGVIRGDSGKWVLGYTLNLGTQTCLGAELWAIFQGLILAWKEGYRKVLVETESPVVVECLKKTPTSLDPNRALIDGCMNLIKRDWDCHLLLIHQEANLCAAWLVTCFKDYPLGPTVFKTPPDILLPILQNDCVRITASPYQA